MRRGSPQEAVRGGALPRGAAEGSPGARAEEAHPQGCARGGGAKGRARATPRGGRMPPAAGAQEQAHRGSRAQELGGSLFGKVNLLYS